MVKISSVSRSDSKKELGSSLYHLWKQILFVPIIKKKSLFLLGKDSF